MTFTELVAEVAKDARLPRQAVNLILRSFIKVTRKAVLSGAQVKLRGFGVFYLAKLRPRELFGEGKKSDLPRKVRFRQSRRKGSPMEKYGVQYDDEKSKTASKDEKCPNCGGKVFYGAVKAKTHPYCETCGTQPFEKQNK